MSLEEAKHWLGARWVLHPDYQPIEHHSSYARVSVWHTFERVRHQMRIPVVEKPVTNTVGPYLNSTIALASERTGSEQNSFSDMVEQTRQRLRLVHGRMA